MDTIAQFKQCLTDMSFCRAGWDFDLPAAQKAEERKLEQEALARAREIWARETALHDHLRAAFREAAPLATMSEIENQKAGV
jgi:hypothetical protein